MLYFQVPDNGESNSSYLDWHLMDVVPQLLDVVLIPIKKQMMSRQCAQSHDHGEIMQNERLAEFCCKFTARLIAEMSFSASHTRVRKLLSYIRYISQPISTLNKFK